MAQPSLNKYQVLPVETRRQWKDFFDLRRFIYRDDPNVVYPLRFMEKTNLDTNKHPFYEHTTRQRFICYENGKAIGRIVAIKDDLHNEHYQDQVGFFGFFECIDNKQVAEALLDRASEWLIEQGCNVVRGPVNPSMKSDFGVLVHGNDDPPFVMMGYTPKYYEDLLMSNGFSVVREFNAYLYDIPTMYEDVMANEEKLLSVTRRVLERYPMLRIGNVDRSTIDKELRAINTLGNSVRASGWGFVPLTHAELDFMVKQLKKVLKPETLLVAYWEDQLVGYCVNVPCVNWALRKSVGRYDWMRIPQFLYWIRKTPRSRVIGLGADEAFRKRGVGVLLSTEMRYRGTRDLNIQQWEFSWIDAQNEASIRAVGRTMPLDHYKTLRLYDKAIG